VLYTLSFGYKASFFSMASSICITTGSKKSSKMILQIIKTAQVSNGRYVKGVKFTYRGTRKQFAKNPFSEFAFRPLTIWLQKSVSLMGNSPRTFFSSLKLRRMVCLIQLMSPVKPSTKSSLVIFSSRYRSHKPSTVSPEIGRANLYVRYKVRSSIIVLTKSST
jgi:hypothetical protein